MSEPKESFGKYELVSRLAIGGMAEIFRARYSPAPGVTKNVVIKRILPHFAVSEAFVNMFTNEAKIAMGLSHGNIAQVFDFGDIKGEYFLAMEFVDGQPLSQVMKRAKDLDIPALPFPLASHISIELLKGLHYAHTRLDETGAPLRIIHRDVSPQNILIGYEGQVKIVDFGIAKARHATGGETEAGAMKGKYSYFSPEQARSKDIDARSDVFSAGSVLYEMVCGQLPFQGRMMEVLSKIIQGSFTPPRELNPDIPPALERILLTAMAKHREDRYPNAEAFQQALSGYLNASAPNFSVSSLPQFTGLLFERELLKQGRPISLSREFLEQVPQWKKPLPSPSGSPLTADTLSGRSKLPVEEEEENTVASPMPLVGEETAAHRSNPRRVWPYFVGLPLSAAVLAAATVFVWAGSAVQTLELTSTPSGAEVFINGTRAPALTPLSIDGLMPNEPHRLEVSAPGMRRWSTTLRPSREARLTVHAELQPVTVPVVAPPVMPALDLTPRTTVVALLAATHAFPVPLDHSARAPLKADKRYRLWTETPARGDSTRLLFELEGPVALERHWGALGREPVTLENASAIKLFLFSDPATVDKTLNVKLQELPKGEPLTLKVSIQHDAMVPSPTQTVAATSLDKEASYTVSLEPGDAQWRPGRIVDTVLLYVDGIPPAVLRKGAPLTVSSAEKIAFTFPDSDLSDNRGSLSITLERQ